MAKLALVTGACGFVGSNMVELLVSEGFRVRATDLESADRSAIESLDIEFIPSDLTRKESLKPLFDGVALVFHPGAIFNFSVPLDVIKKVNAEGTRNLLEAAKDHPIEHVINWSTTGVYGLPPRKLQPITEETPLAPANSYEISKKLQEDVAREYTRKYNMPITIIRPAPIYGPRSRYALGLLIPIIARCNICCSSVFSRSRFPAVHVRDVVGAALFLSQKKETIGETYIVVDDQLLTVFEVPHVIGPRVGTYIYTTHIPTVVIKYLMRFVAAWSSLQAKYITHRPPKVERDIASYLSHAFLFSNEKIKKAGYEFAYPDTQKGIIDSIEWYKREGWIKCPQPIH
ncbi:MAG: NAD-dependent epimerase/dehydratase family protein [bacterium]